MGTNTGHVMTLANSIIGVSVLAMPFCFKQCGILLATLVLLLSNIMSRLACHYILKSAILSRRRTFEFLAFHVFGPTGKLTVELSIIGFMLGTCVAYFVVVGDLGPAIVAPALNLETPANIRPTVLIALAVLVVLPLGLLRNVDSLAAVCTVTIAFYLCLVLKVMGEATNHLIAGDWMDKVNLWRPIGMLQCLPIFSMALSCQTQLFEIFESLPNASLDKMNSVVRSAINMCTAVYMAMGVFGYIAYCTQPFTGNIMMSFSTTTTSEVIKLGFVLSVAVSFPLVIFPCRASLHSLLFRRTHLHHELMGSGNYISEQRFQCITVLIITVSLIIGLLIPNIELVLGLVGSTIGVLICVMVPAVMFICVTNKSNNERLLAQVLFAVGLLIMVLGTYANLYATEEAMSGAESGPVLAEVPKAVNQDQEPKAAIKIKDETLKELKDLEELAALPELKKDNTPSPEVIRQEPPVPVAPVAPVLEKKEVTIDKEAIKKEEDEIKEVEKQNKEVMKKEEDLVNQVVKQEIKKEKKKELMEKYVQIEEVKQQISEEQKQILEEIKKEDKIEKLAEGSDVKVPEDIEKAIEESKSKVDKDNKVENEVVEKIKSDSKNNKDKDEMLNMEKLEQSVDVKQKDSSTMNKKMLKGIPLPIVVQDNLKEKTVAVDLQSVDDKVLRREILGNKGQEEKEDRTKRDIEATDEGKSVDVIEGGGDGMRDAKELVEGSKSDNINHNNSMNVTKPEKTFAQLIKDNKEEQLIKDNKEEQLIKDNKEEHCEDNLKETVPSHGEVKQVVLDVEKSTTKESLIKTPQFLSNPLPILTDSNIQLDMDIHHNDLLPMKRDLKSVISDKREAKDRET